MIQTKEIKKGIYALKTVGYLDLDFHGCIFRNDYGASYNAYLIVDEKITLIDVVDKQFSEAFILEIKKIIKDKPIDYIIINHVEPDHSGGFEAVKSIYPDAQCFCSSEAKKAMLQMFFNKHQYQLVSNLESINLGSRNYVFVLTPFIHWPDNMFTYLVEDKILFSNDAFGSLTNSNLFYDYQYDLSQLLNDAKEYYANIVMPCSSFVANKLEEVLALNLELDYIAPSHGIIWKNEIGTIINQYQKWANNGDVKNKVVIVYDTIWDNTQKIADVIAQAIGDNDLEVRILNASKHRKSLIMSEIMDARAIVVGSSNFNNTMTPSIADVLERIIALKPIDKLGVAFGSFGWVDVHLNRIESRLQEANVKIITHSFYENYTPDAKALDLAYELGQLIANKVNEVITNE
ncbi:MAG: FprA family A-type flavoprotein [Bacilli bacterium]